MESNQDIKAIVQAFLTLLEEWHGNDDAQAESTEDTPRATARATPPAADRLRQTERPILQAKRSIRDGRA